MRLRTFFQVVPWAKAELERKKNVPHPAGVGDEHWSHHVGELVTAAVPGRICTGCHECCNAHSLKSHETTPRMPPMPLLLLLRSGNGVLHRRVSHVAVLGEYGRGIEWNFEGN